MKRHKDNYEYKKFKIYISQMIEDFLPFNTFEEKIEKYNSKDEDYTYTNNCLFYNGVIILSP